MKVYQTGIGWRAVLFVSGCPHHCEGCQNKEAQDFNYGVELDEDVILKKIENNSILKGITISGGEPLCQENINGVSNFIKDVKKIKPDFNVWCYSGYTFEELKDRNDESTNQCLEQIDVLVDGRFKESEKDPTLKFKGSTNQRIIDMSNSIKENKIVEYKI